MLAAAAHALEIHGMAVDPLDEHHGPGRRLLEAARAEARRRGARRTVLRLLVTNAPAIPPDRAAGFDEEGGLHDQFLHEGHPVDVVLLALEPGAP